MRRERLPAGGTHRSTRGAAPAFPGARPELVRRHLDTLVLAGEARPADDERYAPVPEPV